MEAMRKKEIQIQQEKRKSNKLVKNKVIYGSIRKIKAEESAAIIY